MIKFLGELEKWQPSLTIPSGFDAYQTPHRNIARSAAKSITWPRTNIRDASDDKDTIILRLIISIM
jgi:hypothetical protein